MNSILVANWKMYKTIEEAVAFIETIGAIQSKSERLIAVPFTAIQPCAQKAKGTSIQIGAQNMNDALEGAYTGEIAAKMLKDAGASFVILGHSERRRLFQEDNQFIRRKVQRAVDSGLRPILCVGETFEEREGDITQQVLEGQLIECLEGITSPESIIVAYEPVWAIGTGKAATDAIAEQAHEKVRAVLDTIFGPKVASKIPILYGGSVTPSNAKGFLEQKNINGLLIGSASLQPESFAKIVEVSDNIS